MNARLTRDSKHCCSMSAPILSYEGLGLNQGTSWLFRDLDLHIGERDRLALIGRNGVGKTTLLRLIAGQLDSDEGRRTIRPGTRVVLLEQEPAMAGHDRMDDGDQLRAGHGGRAPNSRPPDFPCPAG